MQAKGYDQWILDQTIEQYTGGAEITTSMLVLELKIFQTTRYE